MILLTRDTMISKSLAELLIDKLKTIQENKIPREEIKRFLMLELKGPKQERKKNENC